VSSLWTWPFNIYQNCIYSWSPVLLYANMQRLDALPPELTAMIFEHMAYAIAIGRRQKRKEFPLSRQVSLPDSARRELACAENVLQELQRLLVLDIVDPYGPESLDRLILLDRQVLIMLETKL
jgi:hypothetical protein